MSIASTISMNAQSFYKLGFLSPDGKIGWIWSNQMPDFDTLEAAREDFASNILQQQICLSWAKRHELKLCILHVELTSHPLTDA